MDSGTQSTYITDWQTFAISFFHVFAAALKKYSLYCTTREPLLHIKNYYENVNIKSL